jgi:hypothetical protein
VSQALKLVLGDPLWGPGSRVVFPMDIATPETRVCSACSLPKALDDFSPRPDGKEGRHAQCKECRRLFFRRRRFNKRHRGTPAVLREITRVRDEAAVVALAKGLVERFRGPDRAATELRKFLESEFVLNEIGATRALRGLARIIWTATRIERRWKQKSEPAAQSMPAVQLSSMIDAPQWPPAASDIGNDREPPAAFAEHAVIGEESEAHEHDQADLLVEPSGPPNVTIGDASEAECAYEAEQLAALGDRYDAPCDP